MRELQNDMATHPHDGEGARERYPLTKAQARPLVTAAMRFVREEDALPPDCCAFGHIPERALRTAQAQRVNRLPSGATNGTTIARGGRAPTQASAGLSRPNVGGTRDRFPGLATREPGRSRVGRPGLSVVRNPARRRPSVVGHIAVARSKLSHQARPRRALKQRVCAERRPPTAPQVTDPAALNAT